MDDIWTPQEKAAVESRLGGSIIGSAGDCEKRFWSAFSRKRPLMS
jgi:hypothetical protein